MSTVKSTRAQEDSTTTSPLLRTMKKLLFAVTFLASLTAFADFFQKNVQNDEPVTLTGERFILLGHATSHWDEQRTALHGTRNLIEFGWRTQTPIIATIHSDAFTEKEEADRYYFDDREIDVAVESAAGQHNISFQNVKQIFIGGGNMSLCLCEGIRDLISGSFKSVIANQLNLYLVRDAIYDNWMPSYNPITRDTIDGLITNFLIPAFSCPDQQADGHKRPLLTNVRMDVFFEGKPVKSYDLEPDDNIPLEELKYSIKVHFIRSDDLNKYIPAPPHS